jgi:spermidine synthase
MRLRWFSVALLGIALVSGTAALVYQVVWLRWFQLLFGSTAYAASATLCAFFTGLSLGAALVGRASGRWARPLVLYGAVELGAALFSLIVPLAIGLYEPLYAALFQTLTDRRLAFVAVKYALALVAMLPAATLLGGTLPPLAAALVRDGRELGREGVLLYAVNLLGAALGSAVTAFWLIEALGLRASYGVGVALSLIAGAAALALAGRQRSAPTTGARASEDAAPLRYLAVSFASGFGILAFEVLLIHALAQILSNSVYSFGAVLVVVLLALAAGAGVVSATARRLQPRTLLLAALLGEALLLLALPWLMVTTTGGLSRHMSGTLLHGLALAAGFGGPALLVGGVVLPLTFRLASGGSAGPRLGGLLAANTAGGILGSLLASFLLLEWLGLWPSLATLGLAYGAAALLVAGSPRTRWFRGILIGAPALAILASPANPWRLPVVSPGAGEGVLAVAEGAHGVVGVLESSDGQRRIKLNNQYSLGGSRARVGQERAGHLPLLLHPEPKRVLFVGAATGGTAAAAVAHPVEEIVLVELVPEIQSLAAEYFGFATRGVHRDPRTRLVVEDGRNHLRAAPERYDVVVADLFVPWRPGVGSLYTREHFQAVRDHLTPDGVFCQWLPLYQFGPREFEIVLATFLDVFPNATLWRGDFFARRPVAALVGRLGPPLWQSAVEARTRQLGERGIEDRWVVEPAGFWMLYVAPLTGLGERLRDVPRNTDDRPHFEFRAGRSSPEERQRFLDQGWPELVAQVMEPHRAADLSFLGPPPEGPRWGALLARLSREAVAQDRPAFRRTSREIRRVVPASLLAQPDPTAAESWPESHPAGAKGGARPSSR